jgi:hypothetical protein
MTRLNRLLSILVLMTATALSADLQGTVTAAARPVPIPGARVVLRGLGNDQEAITDAEGVYHLPGLGPGQYSVEVTAQGFHPFTQEKVVVSDGPQVLDIRLDLSNVQESIVVKGSAEVVSLVSNAPDVSQTLNATQIETLPSYQRRVVKYALLDPHVKNVLGQGFESTDSNRLSINAAAFRYTSYILDGVINFDWVYAVQPYQQVAASAVDDVRVITNQYAAEYGTSTAGTIKVSTKSGTSDLTGEAFAYLRPSGIQAEPPVATFHIPNEKEQWGVLVGGPLVKGKTFFFADVEDARAYRGAYIQSPVPSFYVGEDHDFFGLSRFDHYLNDKQELSLRINGYHHLDTNPADRISGFNQPTTGRIEHSQSWGGQLTHSLVIGPGGLNDFRVNFADYFPDEGKPLGPGQVVLNYPNYASTGYSQQNWVHTQLYDLSDTAALNRGAHSIKFGVETVRIFARDYNYVPLGTYNFAPGAPFAGENPISYSQTFGIANIHYGESNFQAFAQDDFKISPRLSGNVGLRYQYQSITTALHNLEPRVGLAWDLTGSGKTKILAGAGVFHDQLNLYTYRRFFLGAPYGPQLSYTIPFGAPGFPAFPNSLAVPPVGASAGLINLYLASSHLSNPYSLQYSLGVERELGNRFVLTANGIHIHTLKQWRADDVNHPAPFIRTGPGQTRSGTAADATRPLAATGYLGIPVRDVTLIDNSASSIYDALDFGIRRTYANRFQTEAHYLIASSATYSMFYADFNSGIPNDWNNWGSAERAPSDTFQHQRFVGSGTVELPHGARFGIVATIASGLPVNPLTGVDNNGDSYTSDRPVLGPDGLLGRNSFRTQMQADEDISMSKRISIRERLALEARVEVFNVLNHRNYISVNGTYGNGALPLATFLKPIAGITNSDPARQIQFTLRFLLGRQGSI